MLNPHFGVKSFGQIPIIILIIIWLVILSLEKYESQWEGSSLFILENKSHVWNHQPVMIGWTQLVVRIPIGRWFPQLKTGRTSQWSQTLRGSFGIIVKSM